jgi:putative Holliday junction resolvase
MKIIAIDYGLKRCGIAVTDDLQIIASPLTGVETKTIFDFLKKYLRENKVEFFVLGEPKRLSGGETHSSENVKKFAADLKSNFGLEIKWVDERFTSVMAKQAILASGVNKKRRQDKMLVDEVSAAIILQSYLDSKK